MSVFRMNIELNSNPRITTTGFYLNKFLETFGAEFRSIPEPTNGGLEFLNTDLYLIEHEPNAEIKFQFLAWSRRAGAGVNVIGYADGNHKAFILALDEEKANAFKEMHFKKKPRTFQSLAFEMVKILIKEKDLSKANETSIDQTNDSTQPTAIEKLIKNYMDNVYHGVLGSMGLFPVGNYQAVDSYPGYHEELNQCHVNVSQNTNSFGLLTNTDRAVTCYRLNQGGIFHYIFWVPKQNIGIEVSINIFNDAELLGYQVRYPTGELQHEMKIHIAADMKEPNISHRVSNLLTLVRSYFRGKVKRSAKEILQLASDVAVTINGGETGLPINAPEAPSIPQTQEPAWTKLEQTSSMEPFPVSKEPNQKPLINPACNDKAMLFFNDWHSSGLSTTDLKNNINNVINFGLFNQPMDYPAEQLNKFLYSAVNIKDKYIVFNLPKLKGMIYQGQGTDVVVRFIDKDPIVLGLVFPHIDSKNDEYQVVLKSYEDIQLFWERLQFYMIAMGGNPMNFNHSKPLTVLNPPPVQTPFDFKTPTMFPGFFGGFRGVSRL